MNLNMEGTNLNENEVVNMFNDFIILYFRLY